MVTMKDIETINRYLFIYSFISICIYILSASSYIFKVPFLAYFALFFALVYILVVLFGYFKFMRSNRALVDFKKFKYRFIRLIISAVALLLVNVLIVYMLA